MAKITWLGEDEEGGPPGPSFTTALGGLKFEKGKAVEVKDKAFIAKAQGNQFFEVELSGEEKTDAEAQAKAFADADKMKEPRLDPTPIKRGPGRPPKPAA